MRYAALVRELSDVEPEEPELPDDARSLTFHVAAGIDIDATDQAAASGGALDRRAG